MPRRKKDPAAEAPPAKRPRAPRKPKAPQAEAPEKELPKGGNYNPVYRPEFAEQARVACERMGATDADLAALFDVSTTTIDNWKVKHPEFAGALKLGKDVADERVARRLYERAIGYSHPAVKIFLPKDSTTPVYADYLEHYPPDTNAGIFWLCNRRPEEFKQRREVAGNVTVPGLAELLESLGDAETGVGASDTPDAAGG